MSSTAPNRLLLDPTITPTPFDSEALQYEANQAKNEDEIEVEGLFSLLHLSLLFHSAVQSK